MAMDYLMNPITEKVVQRLAYERLLLVSGITPRRRPITFRELIAAADEEPRVLAVLPAIVQNKPRMVHHLVRGLGEKPELRKWIEAVFDPKRIVKNRSGITAEECRRIAQAYQNYRRMARRTHRDRLFNLRLNEEDWRALQDLAVRSKTRNLSDLIRRLIHEHHAATTP